MHSRVFLVVASAFVLLIDQLTKLLVVSNLEMAESIQPVPALVPYFQITRSFNTGAAFGFLAGTAVSNILFLVVACVVTVALIVMYPRIEENRPLARFASVLVIGGALGNATDRIVHGHVVDFIHYQIPNLISNVSNLADHAIVLGVGLMLISSWREEQQTTDDTPTQPLAEVEQ